MDGIVPLISVAIAILIVAVGIMLLGGAMIINAFDVALVLWLWKNGTTGKAKVTGIQQMRGGRSTSYYAGYEFSVGDQIYRRKQAEISTSSYRRLASASGADSTMPVRYAPLYPVISYPWSEAVSNGGRIVGVLLILLLGLPVFFIRPRTAIETIAVVCILGIIVAWLIALVYAYRRPRKAFNIIVLIEQESPSRDLFRRIFSIALKKSE